MSFWVMCAGLTNTVPAVGVSSQQPFTFGFTAIDDADDRQQAAHQDDAGVGTEEQTETKTPVVNAPILHMQFCDKCTSCSLM